MKLVILCGGYGTRIREVSQDVPKPMIPIGQRPILWHIMKYYSCFDVKKFVLCLGYKSEVIKDYFLNYQNRSSNFTLDLTTQNIQYDTQPAKENWEITFAETGLDSLTGARVQHIKKYVQDDDTFLLTYGDGIGDIDIKALMQFHKSHGKLVTVTGVRPPGRFGELTLHGDAVVGFNEKPQATEGWISGGFFVCNKGIFDYLNDDQNLILEKEPFEQIVKDEQFMVYKHEGFWHPMDTSRDYHLLSTLWSDQKAAWKVW